MGMSCRSCSSEAEIADVAWEVEGISSLELGRCAEVADEIAQDFSGWEGGAVSAAS